MPAHNQAVLTSSKCALFVIYVAGVSVRRVILKGFGREGRTVSSNSPSTRSGGMTIGAGDGRPAATLSRGQTGSTFVVDQPLNTQPGTPIQDVTTER